MKDAPANVDKGGRVCGQQRDTMPDQRSLELLQRAAADDGGREKLAALHERLDALHPADNDGDGRRKRLTKIGAILCMWLVGGLYPIATFYAKAGSNSTVSQQCSDVEVVARSAEGASIKT